MSEYDEAKPCEMSLIGAFINGTNMACPGCGNIVPVRLIHGVWTFMRHDDRGVPKPASSGGDVTDA